MTFAVYANVCVFVCMCLFNEMNAAANEWTNDLPYTFIVIYANVHAIIAKSFQHYKNLKAKEHEKNIAENQCNWACYKYSESKRACC